MLAAASAVGQPPGAPAVLRMAYTALLAAALLAASVLPEPPPGDGRGWWIRTCPPQELGGGARGTRSAPPRQQYVLERGAPSRPPNHPKCVTGERDGSAGAMCRGCPPNRAPSLFCPCPGALSSYVPKAYRVWGAVYR